MNKEKTYLKPSEYIEIYKRCKGFGEPDYPDDYDLDEEFIHKSVLEDYKIKLIKEINVLIKKSNDAWEKQAYHNIKKLLKED
jgi:hypothetical protein